MQLGSACARGPQSRSPRSRNRSAPVTDVSAQRARAAAQLDQAAQLELADALAGEVRDVANLLERVAAVVGDVERAGVLELPRLEVGEVELDRTGPRIDVEIE